MIYKGYVIQKIPLFEEDLIIELFTECGFYNFLMRKGQVSFYQPQFLDYIEFFLPFPLFWYRWKEKLPVMQEIYPQKSYFIKLTQNFSFLYHAQLLIKIYKIFLPQNEKTKSEFFHFENFLFSPNFDSFSICLKQLGIFPDTIFTQPFPYKKFFYFLKKTYGINTKNFEIFHSYATSPIIKLR